MFFLSPIQSKSIELGYSFKFIFIGLKRRKRKGTKLNITGRQSIKYTKLINSSQKNTGKWPSYLTLQNSCLAFTIPSAINAISQKLRILLFGLKECHLQKQFRKESCSKHFWGASTQLWWIYLDFSFNLILNTRNSFTS